MSTLMQVNNLSKSYGSQVIFENAGMTVNAKQKIGVIGRNGAGKSTLFKMIVKLEQPDSGQILVHAKTRLGYLEQHDPFTLNETVIDFLMRYTGKEEWECGKVADTFQLKNKLLTTQIGNLAGGYQMRVKLTGMLLKEPNLLLLDEPTNYLDLSTLLLLEQFLRDYNGGFLVISHDREFLKNVCNETLEVDNGRLFLYPRPLEEYFDFKAEQLQLSQKYNEKVDAKQKQLQEFVDRFKAKASKAKQAQSKLKQINNLKKIEIDHPMSSVRISIPAVEEKKGLALRVSDMSIGYGDRIVAGDITLDINRGEHVAILGDNGQGKTTFLKTIAGEIQPLAGKTQWMPNIKIAYYAQHVPERLNPKQHVGEYLECMAAPDVTKQEILQMAGNFLFKGDDTKKPISVLSGGERARLCLAGLLLTRSQTFLFDEPNNHLDFETVEALAAALKKCNSTILFVSHNRTFVNELADAIIEIKNGSATRYHGNYEEYVYHLEQSLEEIQEIKPSTAPHLPKITDYQEKKNLKADLRKQQKKLQQLEESIAQNEAQKKALLKDFERNPAYSRERTEKFDKLGKLISNQEQEWLIIQEEIEKLRNILE